MRRYRFNEKAVMMTSSTRFLPLFGLLLITVSAANCAQAGAGDGTLLTSPSSLSAGPLAAGPGASYDASGSWHFVFRLTDGTFLEEGDSNVIQDAEGNITIEGNADTTLTRRPGTGAVLTYDVNTFEGQGACEERYSGVAVVFTRTNTLRANLTGTESDCARLQIEVTGTKN
jgi:hypothetical protein